MAVPPSREAGWYPDPHVPAVERYWNGRVWTARNRPVAAQPGTPDAPTNPGAHGVPPVAPPAPGLGTGAVVGIAVVGDITGIL